MQPQPTPKDPVPVASKVSEWTTVTSNTSKNKEFASLFSSPAPKNREQVENRFTSYCEIAQGVKRSGKPKMKVEFIRHMFNLMRQVDSALAVLPYDPKSSANSITHATHVPSEESEFGVYFPSVMYIRGQLTIKMRITSSVSLWKIKQDIFHMLKAQFYFMRPSQLKAFQTAKIGWFFASHPDLTSRSDFQVWLSPNILQEFGEPIEFQVEPEMERVTVEGNTIAHRVLMARCSSEYVEKMRFFFMKLFDPEESQDIGPVSRYTFVMSMPMGSFSEVHLQQMLKAQIVFKQNVHYFIYMGLKNVDAQCTIRQDDANDIGEEVIQVEEEEIQRAQTNSLRSLLYSVQDNDGDRIHSVYQSADNERTFILCKPHKKNIVLQMLHNLDNIIETFFEKDALETYLPGRNNGSCYVKDFPKATEASEKYASRLSKYVNAASVLPPEVTVVSELTPTSEVEPPERQQERNQKRTREGGFKEDQNHGSVLPAGFQSIITKTQENDKILQQTIAKVTDLDSSMNERLDVVEANQDRMTKDVQKLGEAIVAQSKSLETVQQTQIAQGSALTEVSKLQKMMNEKLDNWNIYDSGAKSPHGEEGEMEE